MQKKDTNAAKTWNQDNVIYAEVKKQTEKKKKTFSRYKRTKTTQDKKRYKDFQRI